MKKLNALATISTLFFLFAANVYAQELSREKSDLWKVSNDIFTTWKDGDFDRFGSMIHDQYQGWSNHDSLPVSKENLISRYRKGKELYQLKPVVRKPVSLIIEKNNAVVYYCFEYIMVFLDKKKKKQSKISGKTTEYFVRVDGNWLLLGDMSDYQIAETE